MDDLMAQNNKARIMLVLQEEINKKIDNDWRLANNPWYRAVWTECAEMMDHVGWKWWKAQEIDYAQVKLELIDIWHFALSEMLSKEVSLETSAQSVSSILDELSVCSVSESSVEEVLGLIELLAAKTLDEKKFDFDSFVRLCKACGLGCDELYVSYVSKNVLNKFRQDHGYKSGGYIKIWNGHEDNFWLSEIVLKLKVSDLNFPKVLYGELKKIYDAIG